MLKNDKKLLKLILIDLIIFWQAFNDEVSSSHWTENETGRQIYQTPIHLQAYLEK